MMKNSELYTYIIITKNKHVLVKHQTKKKKTNKAKTINV